MGATGWEPVVSSKARTSTLGAQPVCTASVGHEVGVQVLDGLLRAVASPLPPRAPRLRPAPDPVEVPPRLDLPAAAAEGDDEFQLLAGCEP
mmetsp:Transcript_87566/g.203673  ORF Transcript_87566/g.203673 Transcript_87566/m.203673 type:complete len:91 (+) Transcript_87566:69-341(+)